MRQCFNETVTVYTVEDQSLAVVLREIADKVDGTSDYSVVNVDYQIEENLYVAILYVHE